MFKNNINKSSKMDKVIRNRSLLLSTSILLSTSLITGCITQPDQNHYTKSTQNQINTLEKMNLPTQKGIVDMLPVVADLGSSLSIFEPTNFTKIVENSNKISKAKSKEVSTDSQSPYHNLDDITNLLNIYETKVINLDQAKFNSTDKALLDQITTILNNYTKLSTLAPKSTEYTTLYKETEKVYHKTAINTLQGYFIQVASSKGLNYSDLGVAEYTSLIVNYPQTDAYNLFTNMNQLVNRDLRVQSSDTKQDNLNQAKAIQKQAKQINQLLSVSLTNQYSALNDLKGVTAYYTSSDFITDVKTSNFTQLDKHSEELKNRLTKDLTKYRNLLSPSDDYFSTGLKMLLTSVQPKVKEN